jgi:tetratricopeptide (TPR) repeat protein
MKKLIFTGVLCLVASLSFAQKKAVSTAKNEIKGNTPNIEEARSGIKGALTNPETENDAETWYVAGLIEDKQFDLERAKEILGQKANDVVMYTALEKIIPYFTKAAQLDLLPDEKGKVKPKYLKDIRAKIKANRPFYINAGLFHYEKQEYKAAYENFKLYGDIPALDILKDEKWEVIPGDSTAIQIRYYAGLAAALVPDHQAAIEILEEIKDKGYNEKDVYQMLCSEYEQIKDSALYEKALEAGFAKFPNENYYVLNLINLNINRGNSQTAIAYLATAIQGNPQNAQLYDVLGQVYESNKDAENAIVNLKKALEIEPDNTDVLLHIGRVYFNLGVETRTNSDNISDLSKSKAEAQKALDCFKDAMPFFEKVFENDSKNIDAIYALRSIYYNLGMGELYEKMDALYNAQ